MQLFERFISLLSPFWLLYMLMFRWLSLPLGILKSKYCKEIRCQTFHYSIQMSSSFYWDTVWWVHIHIWWYTCICLYIKLKVNIIQPWNLTGFYEHTPIFPWTKNFLPKLWKKKPVAFIEAFRVSCINSGFQCNNSGYSFSVKMYAMVYIKCKPVVVFVNSCSIYNRSSTNRSLRTHSPCRRSVCYSTNS